jgi:hypothetical protein
MIFLPCIQAAKLFLKKIELSTLSDIYLILSNSYEAEKMWYFCGKGAILFAPTVLFLNIYDRKKVINITSSSWFIAFWWAFFKTSSMVLKSALG